MKNKKKYLIQHKNCGGLLFKTETGISFNTEIKCPKCKKIVKVPQNIVVTLDKGFGKEVK